MIRGIFQRIDGDHRDRGNSRLEHVTVDGCTARWHLLSNGAAFDIENTTVANNGPSSDLSSGAESASAPFKSRAWRSCNLVTIQNNKAAGLYVRGSNSGQPACSQPEMPPEMSPQACNVFALLIDVDHMRSAVTV